MIMTISWLDRLLDNVYYYVFKDAVGRCNLCNYKNEVVYKCSDCSIRMCLTCYMDACVGRRCKWCVEKTYVMV